MLETLTIVLVKLGDKIWVSASGEGSEVKVEVNSMDEAADAICKMGNSLRS